jgi:undecaprenyl-diphosphatase
MVSILEAVLLGIIQGITEWLPISSSGHLVIFQELFNIKASIMFDLMLHIGSLIVILIIFYKDILRVVSSVFNDDKEGKKLLLLLALSTIITAIIGLLFQDFFESLFTNIKAVGIALIATAILLFSVKLVKVNRKKAMGISDAIIIGLMQGIAIIPGISRSGTTISAGLLRGIDRELAIRFSFLLFIPAIIGATILQLNDFVIEEINIMPMIVGLIVSVIVSYITVKMLIKIIKTHKFYMFGYYCLAVGLIIVFSYS